MEIEKDFYLSSHLTTQWQWAKIMRENPSHFKDGPEIEIGKKKIKMKPNHPAENMNWYEVGVFLDKANELSKNDEPLIYQVFPDHVKGAVYRRPLDAEQEFVLKNRGLAKGKYAFDLNESDIYRYAWLSPNSNSQTHEVGLKDPFIIEGNEFYDLIGNVNEWSEDLLKNKSPILLNSYRGGCWSSNSKAGYSENRTTYHASGSGAYLGFRLVRTVP